jgi:hypothetical protein
MRLSLPVAQAVSAILNGYLSISVSERERFVATAVKGCDHGFEFLAEPETARVLVYLDSELVLHPVDQPLRGAADRHFKEAQDQLALVRKLYVIDGASADPVVLSPYPRHRLSPLADATRLVGVV